uniref:Ankyrin repeat protein n=1 Tax=viral metagenome TaxID=1070528 RepID=A0A6C0ECJ4_9ZZZZ
MYFVTTFNNNNEKTLKTGLNTRKLNPDDNYYSNPYLIQYNFCTAKFLIFYPLKYISQIIDDCDKSIQFVIIPHDARVVGVSYKYVRQYRIEIKGCITANKFILSKKYSMSDVKIIEKFKIEIGYNYVTSLCESGKLNILDYLFKHNKITEYHDISLDLASRNDHINILEWWYNSGLPLPLKCSERALELASAKGHVNILEWWKKSGLPLEYDENVLRYASNNKNINVLDWWLNSGLPLKYSEKILNDILVFGGIDVLRWWFNSKLLLKYPEYSQSKLNDASVYDDPNKLSKIVRKMYNGRL